MADDANKFLELMDPQAEVPKVPAISTGTSQENYNKDYEFTRDKLKKLAEIGQTALEHFKEIAEETGEPSAYRVVGELLSANKEIINSIIENAKAKSEIDVKIGGKPADGGAKNVTNNTTVFVGTTKDIIRQAIVEEAKKTIDGEAKEVPPNA